MKLIPPISALIPWESYDYQGHIALYVTLKKIRELLIKAESLSAYELQIEGEEDFSLLKDNKYLSLHQVKAGRIYLYENDKFAFLIGLIENDKAIGYFHINSTSKIDTDFCESTITHIDSLLKELSKEVVSKEDISNDADYDKYLIFEKISKSLKKGDSYNIIKNAANEKYPSGYDIDKIKSVVPEIVLNLSNYRNEIEKVINKKEITEPDKEYLQIYPERFDTNSEIRDEALGVVIDVLNYARPEYSTFVNREYARLVYDRLFLFMKDKITNHLKNASSTDKCLISFEEILEVILVNYSDELNTEEYQYYQVIRALEDVYADYPNQVRTSCSEIRCKDCAEQDSCNLNLQIKELLSKEDITKKDVIHNLIMFEPQKGRNNNLPSDSLISYLMCDVLKEISTMKLNDKAVFQAIRNDLDVYRLTLDESRDQYEMQRKLQRFISNEVDKTLLYETDVLITDRLDNQSLVFNEDRINVLGEKELKELRDNNVSSMSIDEMKKESNRPKVIRLIDKNTAKGELK